jgi:hypothetical protein
MAIPLAPNSGDYPDLHQFLASYFHEDWVDDVTTAAQAFDGTLGPDEHWYKRVVERYVRLEGRAKASRTREQLQHLLKQRYPDQQLAEFAYRRLGCLYHPGPGLPFSPWLSEVEEHLGRCLLGAT